MSTIQAQKGSSNLMQLIKYYMGIPQNWISNIPLGNFFFVH